MLATILDRFIARCALFAIAAALWPLPADAQQRPADGAIAGIVLDAGTRDPVSNVMVMATPGAHAVRADDRGAFVIAPLPPGTYTLHLLRVGFEPGQATVTVPPGDTARTTVLVRALPTRLAEIEVQAGVLSPDLAPPTELGQQQVREANPQDLGDVMRILPGVDAVRRGPVGLDPSVRGLRETEVGVYIDGTRMFPGGPARMDSPLSHLDPSTIRSLEVVKGPYALTWGAGNLTAIRVRTQALASTRRVPLHGTITTGYTGNADAGDALGTISGSSGRFAYLASGAWRRGYDYTSGNGTVVPADFRTGEGRGKLGYRLADDSYVTLAGGYQDQGPIDYPGNLLNAKFFHTYNAAAEWKRERATGVVRSVDALAYTNHVGHAMTNDGKPTAYPDSTRMPPFPLDVTVNARVRVSGGRAAVKFAPEGPWRYDVGADIYSANRNAVRRVSRRDTGMLMFTDLMWPDATITDGGVFTRASRTLGRRFAFSATGRVDVVRAHADTASDFFLQNTSGHLTSHETNVSGATTLRADVSRHWSTTLGLGSAMRTADATERYSDRVPASKSQTSAEFMGNPDLKPERSTQLDVWVEARYARVSFQINPFVRWMDNYITIEPTNLPKRLPLSPDTVYRYTNGRARYWGADVSSGYAFTSSLTGRLGITYLRGENETLSEPALGVAPLEVLAGFRFQPEGGRGWLDASLQAVRRQDRVAALLGETSTAGYAIADLRMGLTVMPSVELRAGILNIGGAQYVDHLNAKNPYTGVPIPEVGRSAFANLTVAF